MELGCNLTDWGETGELKGHEEMLMWGGRGAVCMWLELERWLPTWSSSGTWEDQGQLRGCGGHQFGDQSEGSPGYAAGHAPAGNRLGRE